MMLTKKIFDEANQCCLNFDWFLFIMFTGTTEFVKAWVNFFDAEIYLCLVTVNFRGAEENLEVVGAGVNLGCPYLYFEQHSIYY